MPAIIYLYIAKKFLKYLFIVYLVFAGIVFLLDIAEIIAGMKTKFEIVDNTSFIE